ncbi:MAG TPA: chloride channel protein [Acidimicrobiales bacterium]|nr:chloride channel protein [Acidimicrobiales bacterium]
MRPGPEPRPGRPGDQVVPIGGTTVASGRSQPLTLGPRRALSRLLSGLRRAPYLRKWLVLGTLIGVVAGLGAVVFYYGLHEATKWILGYIGGYTPAGTAGEGGGRPASGFSRPWAIPLVVAGGALAAGILVFTFAPEAEGHGTDAAIKAVHTNPKGIRPRSILVKLAASMLTIGSGGSGGRKGPTAQISAGFGSVLARVMNLTPADSRICVAAGIASGIGAIFRAPLGGALLGAELMYREDVEIEALIPSVVATAVAYGVFSAVTGGFTPIFGVNVTTGVQHFWQFILFAALGLVCGVWGRLYSSTFYGMGNWFKKWPLPRAVRPAVAGLVVGLIGLEIPGVLGTGYGQVQTELDIHQLMALPLWIALVLPAAKILATSLSIGSGGSGGIFGPGLVVGAAAGAGLWKLFDLAGFAPHDPSAFVIIGMMAGFGAIAHAPLAVTIMVAEMTGNLSLLAPAMVAVAVASAVVGDQTIYESQLRRRSDSVAHRLSLGLPASESVPVTSIMARPTLVLLNTTPAAEALGLLQGADLPGAPVTTAGGAFVGSVQTPTLADQVARGQTGPVGRMADVEAMTLPADVGLDAAVQGIPSSKGGWIPVLDNDMNVVGIVSNRELVQGWQMAVGQWASRLAGAVSTTGLADTAVAAGAAAEGSPIRRLALPTGTVIVSVTRGDAMISPDGDLVLEAGDSVTLTTRAEDRERVLALFGAPPGGPAPPGGRTGDPGAAPPDPRPDRSAAGRPCPEQAVGR